MDQVQAYIAQFDIYLSKYKTLKRIEATVGVPKVYFTLGIYFLISISVFFNLLAGLTTGLLSIIYPTYRAFEACHKNDTSSLQVWMTYFFTISCLNVLELGIDTILNWFPYYYVVKLGFVFWLMLPQYLGAKHIYNFVLPQLVPFFKRAEATEAAAKQE
ncbi:ER membrane protein DP1/Yop1 [Gaertneriomyces sp. JEL0708]|nr:ER membrane protein DP1/Yop1 [Gaertneriomyces sp. JEL0708]